MDLRAALAQCPIAAILRGVKPGEIDAIGDALVDAGITVIEVLLNSPNPFDSIARLAARHGARALIGAGTVLEVADVARLKDAGGRLMVAPNFDADVVRAAKASGLATLPGATTPSEGFGLPGVVVVVDASAPAVRAAGAQGRSRWAETVSRRDHSDRGVQGLARGVPGRHADARGRRRWGRQSEDLRGSRCLRLWIGSALYKPGCRRLKSAGSPAPTSPLKGLIFRPFWLISPLREEWPLVRQKTRKIGAGGLLLLGPRMIPKSGNRFSDKDHAQTRYDDDEAEPRDAHPAHLPSGRGRSRSRFPIHWGAATARASAGPSSARSTPARTATPSARTAAPIRSIARWRSRPAR